MRIKSPVSVHSNLYLSIISPTESSGTGIAFEKPRTEPIDT